MNQLKVKETIRNLIIKEKAKLLLLTNEEEIRIQKEHITNLEEVLIYLSHAHIVVDYSGDLY